MQTKKTVKIIPCLDIKAGRVVKGVKFVDIKDAGDPVELAVRYRENGADALAFLDITASIEKRGTMMEWVRPVTENAGVPVTVGGGIADLKTAQALKKMGVASVSLNSAAISRPVLLSECVNELGGDAVVLAVDVASNAKTPSGWEVLTDGGLTRTGIDAIQWIEKGLSLGCGSILPTVLDKDGTRSGYDLKLIRKLCEITNKPIFASGGAGQVEHFVEAAEAGATYLLAASVFHFGLVKIPELKKRLFEKGFTIGEQQ